MKRKLSISSAFAVALAFTFTVFSADGSGAVAQDRTPQIAASPAAAEPAPLSSAEPALVAAPQSADADSAEPAPAAPVLNHESLAQLVASEPSTDLSRDLECLAGAIYFEAKSETLEGQLAVGRVIVNRARSGRFPTSYCGVVFQRSQFSFVHGSAMPTINRSSQGWKNAAAIAQIAHEGSWTSAAEGALFFHAARVSPSWNLTRVARVDSHIFYR